MHSDLYPSRKEKWKPVIIVKLATNVTYQRKTLSRCVSACKED